MQEHLIGAVDKLINANYYDLFANGTVSAKNMISEKLGNSDRSSSSSSKASVGTPLAAQQAATGGIKTGVIDTQHVSLRNESSAALSARDAIRGAGSSVGSRLARAVGMDAGKVDKVVEAKTGAGLGRVADGPAGPTFYLGEGTSLR